MKKIWIGPPGCPCTVAIGFFLVLGLGVLSEGIEVPTVEVRRITKPIRLDGKIENAEWAEAAILELMDFRGAATKYKTTAWLGYNEEALLVGFRCQEPDRPLIGKDDGDEKSIFFGDVVEVFLDVNQTGKTFWHLAVDASGRKYDAFGGDKMVQLQWQAASAISEGEWTAELQIPFNRMDIDPLTKTIWRGDLFRGRRERRGLEPDMGWSLISGNQYAKPEFFAEFRGLHVDFSRFFLTQAVQSRETIKQKLMDIQEMLAPLDSEIENTSEIRAQCGAITEELARVMTGVSEYKEQGRKPFEELRTLLDKTKRFQQKVSLVSCANKSGLDLSRMDFLVGVTNSMARISSTQGFVGLLSNNATLQLARNEYEGLQVVIFPLGKPLQEVTVEVGELKGRSGTKIRSTDIDIRSVLEVHIDETLSVDNLWPEVLGKPGPIDIPTGGIQSALVTVHAKQAQRAGDYQGTITIRARDMKPVTICLNVTVWDFELPAETHCHTGLFDVSELEICRHFSLTLFTPEFDAKMAEIFEYFAARRIQPGHATPVSPRSLFILWQGRGSRKQGATMGKLQDVEALVDPHFKEFAPWSREAVEYWEKWAIWWRKRGLSLGSIATHVLSLSFVENQQESLQALLELYWPVIKKHGWENLCYIRYPDEIDEPGKPGPETVQKVGPLVKQYAPGLRRQSVQTARTPQDPYLNNVDLWFLYASSWDKEKGLYQKLMGDPEKTFWLGLHGHCAFSDPAVAPRIFFTILRKFGFQGAGLWTSTWDYTQPTLIDGNYHIKAQALSNARSCLIWPAKGELLYSKRLELIRDGIEDYEYHEQLATLIKEADKVQTSSPRIKGALNKARQAYAIKDELVKDIKEYSVKAEDLLSFRSELAGAIVELKQALHSFSGLKQNTENMSGSNPQKAVSGDAP